MIKSEFNPEGVLNYGDFLIKGESEKEILISTYIWLTLVWGPDYVVTKIIYAFSTIIIIPIVVNKLTGDK